MVFVGFAYLVSFITGGLSSHSSLKDAPCASRRYFTEKAI